MKNGNKFRILIFLIIGTACWSFIFLNILEMNIQKSNPPRISAAKELNQEKNDEYLKICTILNNLDDDDGESAVQNIQILDETDCAPYLKEYFEKFLVYVSAKKKERKPLYFFKEMENFQNFLTLNYSVPKFQARNLSETVPFYLLKNYELKSKGCSELCDKFLEISESNHKLTKKAAVCVCLKIRRIYEADGIVKNSDVLKKIKEQIAIYRQEFPNELNGNPEFYDEERWLDTFDSFLNDRINNPVMGIFTRISFNKNIEGLGEK